MKIAHISDVHFGRIAYPEVVPALVEEINAAGVELVAVSGDLTQRARRRQFEAAVAMIEQFEAPTLVVPGNHDVYAWWHRPIKRVFRPLSRYRRYFGDDLAPTFERDGLAVLGLNSAHGRTIKGGRIGDSARARVRSFFKNAAPEAFKVLVLHHHLTAIQALGPHDVARKARQTLTVAAEVGVELVLCGHLHVSHVEPVEVAPAGHRLVIASAGTATSNRGRAAHRDTNFFNLVEVAPASFCIHERRYDPDVHRFVEHATLEFDRDEAS